MIRGAVALSAVLLLAACGGGGGSGSQSAGSPNGGGNPPSVTGALMLGSGTNLRRDGNDFIATFRDADGTTYDARQLRGTEAWLVENAAPLDGLLVYGQSNAGLAARSDLPQRITTPMFPSVVVSNGSRFFGSPEYPYSPGGGRFANLYDDRELAGHFPATLTAYAAERIARDAGRAPVGLYSFTQFEASRGIEAFLKGTDNYRALLADVERTTASVALYKRQFAVRAILWIHGETYSADYGAKLEQLAGDLAADVRAITGQTSGPEIMIQQANAGMGEDGDPAAVALDQLALARRAQGHGITMVGPMYQARFNLDNPLHPSDTGKMLLADTAAVAFDRIRRGGSFTPLWPVSLTRTGAVIDVAFAVPGNGLAFDSDVVAANAFGGFEYRDSSNSARIERVEILDGYTVRITLDRVPAGANRELRYALDTGPWPTGFPAGRGLLYSPTDTASVFARLSYPVPAYVRHYAVRFREPVP